MPYPNEHACRLHSPSPYVGWARISRRSASIGKTYDVIRGKKHDGTWEDQAFRYPRDRWSADQARRHCNAHDGTFEAASPRVSERQTQERRNHVMRLQRNIATLQFGIPIRQETFEGRPHLIVPVVALVEGVHVGSRGSAFYPGEEIGKYVDAWNGIPLPVFHPEEYEMNVSANTPQLIEERSVGRLFNASFDPDGSKLKGELWIDIGKAEKISPAVLSLIRSNRHLEVSTALWSDGDGTPGQWRGEEFDATVRNYRPDHLALLPGGEGACSWADGCGVRVNDIGGGKFEVSFQLNIRGTARTPSFDGTESVSWANVTTSFSAYRDAYYRSKDGRPDNVPTRVQDAPSALRNWIASKTLLGEGSADNERDLIFFPVVNPKTGKLNEGALRAVISGRGAQARIPAEAKASAQRKARNLLNKHFGAELEVGEAMKDEKSGLKEKLKALIQSVADAVGLHVQELSHEELRSKIQRTLDTMDNPGWIHFVKEVYDGSVVYEARGNNPSETGQPAPIVKLYRRGFSVDDNDEITLKDDTEEVKEEKTYVPVENTSTIVNKDHIKKSEEAVMEKKELIEGLITCDQTKFEEKDREWLATLEVEKLERLGVLEKKESEKKPGEEEPKKEPEKKEEKLTGNEAPTVEQYIEKAPPEIQGVLNRAVKRDQIIKSDLVKALMANDRNSFSEEQLKAKEIDELENLVGLGRIEVDFSGQTGGPAGNVDDDKTLTMPLVFDLEKKSA